MGLREIGNNDLMGDLHREPDQQRQFEAKAEDGRLRARKQRRDQKNVQIGEEKREERHQDEGWRLAPPDPDIAARRRLRRQSSGKPVLRQQPELDQGEPAEDDREHPSGKSGRQRNAQNDEQRESPEQEEGTYARVRQIGEREAAQRCRKSPVQPQRCVGRNGQRGCGRRKPNLRREPRPEPGEGQNASRGDGGIEGYGLPGKGHECGDESVPALFQEARHEARRDGRITLRRDQAGHRGKAGNGIEHAERGGL